MHHPTHPHLVAPPEARTERRRLSPLAPPAIDANSRVAAMRAVSSTRGAAATVRATAPPAPSFLSLEPVYSCIKAGRLGKIRDTTAACLLGPRCYSTCILTTRC